MLVIWDMPRNHTKVLLLFVLFRIELLARWVIVLSMCLPTLSKLSSFVAIIIAVRNTPAKLRTSFEILGNDTEESNHKKDCTNICRSSACFLRVMRCLGKGISKNMVRIS